MQTFGLKDEHIKLGQLLKATGLVGSGVDAKIVVQEGLVKVNGKVCYMRGKKSCRVILLNLKMKDRSCIEYVCRIAGIGELQKLCASFS